MRQPPPEPRERQHEHQQADRLVQRHCPVEPVKQGLVEQPDKQVDQDEYRDRPVEPERTGRIAIGSGKGGAHPRLLLLGATQSLTKSVVE